MAEKNNLPDILRPPVNFFQGLIDGVLSNSVFNAPAEFLIKLGEDLNEGKNYTLKQFQTWIDGSREIIERAEEIKKNLDEGTQKALNNRIISSLIGSPFGDFRLSGIEMNFREHGKDVRVEDLVRHYIRVIAANNSDAQFIIYVHGLFNDETLWTKIKPGKFLMAEELKNKHFYPIYLRYHPGLHISENGKLGNSLFQDLFDELEKYDIKNKIHVVTYSMGGLVFRSSLYYAKVGNHPGCWRKKISKIIFISSPDAGSYLEKMGFWLAIGLSLSKTKLIRRIALASNIRAESMKDLSHGIIREEDWNTVNYFQRFLKPVSYGEIEGLDVYQIFSLLTEKESRWQNWMGDGVVEHYSLTALTKEIQKKPNSNLRTRVLYGKNHFNILDGEDTYKIAKEILFN